MGGVIGALSTKFALTAGTLLLAARVDMHPVTAALDPSLSTTQISRTIVRKHFGANDDAAARAGLWIALDRTEIRLHKFAFGDKASPDVVIGADILGSMPLALDFKSHRLRVMESGEFRRATSKMISLATTITSDGCLSLGGVVEGGRAVRGAIVGRSQADERTPAELVQFGPAKLAAVHSATSGCPANDYELWWAAFDQRYLILDLAHNRVWITPSALEK